VSVSRKIEERSEGKVVVLKRDLTQMVQPSEKKKSRNTKSIPCEKSRKGRKRGRKKWIKKALNHGDQPSWKVPR